MTQAQKDLIKQQEILNGFRKSEIDYYDIPTYWETYAIEGWGKRIEYIGFTALRVVCTIEELEKESIAIDGVVLQTSSEGKFVAVPARVLWALKEERIAETRFSTRGLNARPAVYQLYTLKERPAWAIHTHWLIDERMVLYPKAFRWYDIGCMSVSDQEVKMMLEHPLVKQFLK